jgi:hypothetical protein
VAAWSKTYVYGRSLAEITGSNFAGDMDVLSPAMFLCCTDRRCLWDGMIPVQRTSTDYVVVSLIVIRCNSNPLYLQ